MRPAQHVSRIAPPYRPLTETRPDYSRLPVAARFNWEEAFADVERGEWYLVAFRSKHRLEADHEYLTWLDQRASRAASRHPGFLYYFVGTPRVDGSCLSFCLWHSRQYAIAAAADPEHRVAMTEGLPFFEHYRLERYHVRKASADLVFLPLDPAMAAPGPLPPVAPSSPVAK